MTIQDLEQLAHWMLDNCTSKIKLTSLSLELDKDSYMQLADSMIKSISKAGIICQYNPTHSKSDFQSIKMYGVTFYIKEKE